MHLQKIRLKSVHEDLTTQSRSRTQKRVIEFSSSLAMSCKIGNEGMDDADLTTNAITVINVEKKLPNGENYMVEEIFW